MKTKMNFNMWIPTRILFGADELKNLHRQHFWKIRSLPIPHTRSPDIWTTS